MKVSDFAAHPDLTAALRARRIRVTFGGVVVTDVEVLNGTFRLHLAIPGVRVMPPKTVEGTAELDVEEVGNE